jgi:hypothetical protein
MDAVAMSARGNLRRGKHAVGHQGVTVQINLQALSC